MLQRDPQSRLSPHLRFCPIQLTSTSPSSSSTPSWPSLYLFTCLIPGLADRIQPCTKGTHTTAPPPKPTAPFSSSPLPSAPTHIVDENGVETYGVAPKPPSTPAPVAAPTPPPAAPIVTEGDDPTLPVPEGASCKRLGCGMQWEGEEVSRGSGEQAKCRYHPQAVCHPL